MTKVSMMKTWSPETGSLDIATLGRLYRDGSLTPSAVVSACYDRIAARGDDHVWIHLAPRETVMAQAKALEAGGPTTLVEHAVLPINFACPNFIRVDRGGAEGSSDAASPWSAAVAAAS